MKVDICIPAYNEAPIIADTIRAVAAELERIPNISWQIIVADNGSTDETGSAVSELAIPNVSVLSISPKGKGAAVVAAAKASVADVFGFIDADLSADPSNIRNLLSFITEADIVIGSRLLKEARVDRSWWRSLSSKLFNLTRSRMLGIHVSDTQCGLKLTNDAGRRELAGCLEQGWFFDVEWLARANDSHLRIREVPISWTEQRYEGRKAKLNILKDGLQSIGAFSRIRSRLKLEATRGA